MSKNHNFKQVGLRCPHTNILTVNGTSAKNIILPPRMGTVTVSWKGKLQVMTK